MKKLILLFISLLAVGAAFQSCDNTKTYAEMLEEERDGVNDFINKYNIFIFIYNVNIGIACFKA